MPTQALLNMLRDLPAAVLDEVRVIETDRDTKAGALDIAAAENIKLRKQLESGGSGIPTWTPATVVSAGSTWFVPDGTPANIIVPAGAVGVTLYLGSGLWPKIPSRPFLSVYGDLCKVIGVPGRFTFDAASGASVGGNGRYGIAECVRVGQEAQPYTSPVRGTVLIDVSLNRADALAKLYPDCDGATLVRPVTTGECKADGVFCGGAKNVRVIDPDLTCTTENTIRATTQNGVMPENISVIGDGVTGGVRNLGGKAALNPRNVKGFSAFAVRLFATKNNSAVGIGNGDGNNPGNPTGVTIQACEISGGSLTIHQGHTVALTGNRFRWPAAQDNSAIGVTAASADNVTITDNGGESAVPQKAMVGYVGDRGKIRNLVDRDNAWSIKP